jgi:hypothetical protein
MPRHVGEIPPSPPASPSNPAENPTAVRISDGESFREPLPVTLAGSDGEAQSTETRDGVTAQAVYAPGIEALLSQVLEEQRKTRELLTLALK